MEALARNLVFWQATSSDLQTFFQPEMYVKLFLNQSNFQSMIKIHTQWQDYPCIQNLPKMIPNRIMEPKKNAVKLIIVWNYSLLWNSCFATVKKYIFFFLLLNWSFFHVWTLCFCLFWYVMVHFDISKELCYIVVHYYCFCEHVIVLFGIKTEALVPPKLSWIWSFLSNRLSMDIVLKNTKENKDTQQISIQT